MKVENAAFNKTTTVNAPAIANAFPFKGSFMQVLERFIDPATEKRVANISNRIQAGEVFSNQELLRYQYQFHDLSVRTEMVSKVGEAFTGTLRRLQQPG